MPKMSREIVTDLNKVEARLWDMARSGTLATKPIGALRDDPGLEFRYHDGRAVRLWYENGEPSLVVTFRQEHGGSDELLAPWSYTVLYPLTCVVTHANVSVTRPKEAVSYAV